MLYQGRADGGTMNIESTKKIYLRNEKFWKIIKNFRGNIVTKKDAKNTARIIHETF